MIYKPVLVKIVGLLRGDIQYPGRLDISVLGIGNKLCVAAQMSDTVGSDLSGKRNRNHLFLGGNKSPRLLNDLIDGIQTVLNGLDPPFIHDLMKNLSLVLNNIFAGTDHFKQILKVSVVFLHVRNRAYIFIM